MVWLSAIRWYNLKYKFKLIKRKNEEKMYDVGFDDVGYFRFVLGQAILYMQALIS